MHRCPLVVCLALAAASVLSGWPTDARAEDERWPIWPTEIDEIAAPLRDPEPKASQERERELAVRALEHFATPPITPDIVAALEDPSAQVRREALRVCYQRRIRACIPAAAAIWSKGLEPTLRTAALKVLAVDPDPARFAILLSALRDSNDQIRAQAAQFLGWAPLTSAGRRDVRAALVAKLGDVSALVRRRAVESLGLLGPGKGTLAISRLLRDPEPTVRAAAAGALARYRDPRAVPALLRAIDGVNEAMVTKAMLEALAQLSGPSVAEELLARFDDPPSGLTSRQLADAVGTRPDPERSLVDGLIARLREEELRPAALHALLLMGDTAAEALREAQRRGLSPSVALEVERLLAALEPMDAATPDAPVWPDGTDHGGWMAALQRGHRRGRIDAAEALAVLAPNWLGLAIEGALSSPGPLASRRPWVMALALAHRPVDLDALAWARLQGWVSDATLVADDRCLAAAGLGTASTRDDRKQAVAALTPLLEDLDPLVRACAALPFARVDADPVLRLEPLLLDAVPRVRTSAALALATLERPRTTQARLALLHAWDPSPAVRAAAGVATLVPSVDPQPVRVTTDTPEAPWSELPRWLELEHAGHRLWVPLLGPGRHRWALVPALDLTPSAE